MLVAAPSSATVIFHSVATPAARRQPWRQRHQASSARQENRQYNEQQNNSLSVYFQQKRTFARGRKRTKTDYFEKYSFEDIGEKKSRDNKNILIIGSSGVLGKTLVSHLGSNCDWNVIGADIREASDEKGLRDFIRLPAEASMAELTGGLYRGLLNLQEGKMNENKLDAIVCASGSWKGDVDMRNLTRNHLAKENTSDLEDVEIDIEEEYARESTMVEEMMRANFYPVVAGSQVGRRFMKRGGNCDFCTTTLSDSLTVHIKNPVIALCLFGWDGCRAFLCNWSFCGIITDSRDAWVWLSQIGCSSLHPKLGTYIRGRK